MEEFCALVTICDEHPNGHQEVLVILHESKWPADLAGKMAGICQHVVESRRAVNRRPGDSFGSTGVLAKAVQKLPPLVRFQ